MIPQYTPGGRPRCEHHPGVSWAGDIPCFVCHPTEEAEGTRQYPESLVPDPTEYMRPAVNQCVVLVRADQDTQCKRPGNGRTVLGCTICDECFQSMAYLSPPSSPSAVVSLD